MPHRILHRRRTYPAGYPIAHVLVVLSLSVFLAQCAANKRPIPVNQALSTAVSTTASAPQPTESPEKTLNRFNTFLDRA